LRQPLDVGEQVARWDFGAAAEDGFVDGVVDEDVLEGVPRAGG
jgi:hypothetical protein